MIQISCVNQQPIVSRVYRLKLCGRQANCGAPDGGTASLTQRIRLCITWSKSYLAAHGVDALRAMSCAPVFGRCRHWRSCGRGGTSQGRLPSWGASCFILYHQHIWFMLLFYCMWTYGSCYCCVHRSTERMSLKLHTNTWSNWFVVQVTWSLWEWCHWERVVPTLLRLHLLCPVASAQPYRARARHKVSADCRCKYE